MSRQSGDGLVETIRSELGAVSAAVAELDAAVQTEPTPGVFAMARVLVEAGEVRTRLAGLVSLVEGSRS